MMENGTGCSIVVRHNTEAFAKRCFVVPGGHSLVQIVDKYQVGIMQGPCFLHYTDNTLNDVIHVSKVTLAVAIVEDLNSFALTQLVGEAKVSHIWTTSRAINSEEAKTCRWNIIKFAIGMCLSLIHI